MFIGPGCYGQVGRSASACLRTLVSLFDVFTETQSGCSWSQFDGGGSAGELFSVFCRRFSQSPPEEGEEGKTDETSRQMVAGTFIRPRLHLSVIIYRKMFANPVQSPPTCTSALNTSREHLQDLHCTSREDLFFSSSIQYPQPPSFPPLLPRRRQLSSAFSSGRAVDTHQVRL